jgi:sigma-54 dependent transcriptional regulator, flagellar regulatory protein
VVLQHEFHSAGNKHYSHPVDLGIVGESEAIRSLVQQVRTVARSSVSVMICGATGTGKELIARAIHKCSSVASSPYIPVNCGAIPFDLVESELFGHERGAFTGAHARRIGYFENANKGTLFLDEIGDMRYEMQVKLLRVLDSGSITRVGSNVSLPLDVRVISATHRDMEQYISDGRFREDLFYRLGVVLLHVPALAERREDIPELIEHFQKIRRGGERVHLNPSAIERLKAHSWPGNVRELRNFVERASVLYPSEVIDARAVEQLLGRKASRRSASEQSRPEAPTQAQFDFAPPPIKTGSVPIDLRAEIEDMELEHIRYALTQAEGVISDAARLLSLKRTTLIEKMRKYGVDRPTFADDLTVNASH